MTRADLATTAVLKNSRMRAFKKMQQEMGGLPFLPNLKLQFFPPQNIPNSEPPKSTIFNVGGLNLSDNGSGFGYVVSLWTGSAYFEYKKCAASKHTQLIKFHSFTTGTSSNNYSSSVYPTPENLISQDPGRRELLCLLDLIRPPKTHRETCCFYYFSFFSSNGLSGKI